MKFGSFSDKNGKYRINSPVGSSRLKLKDLEGDIFSLYELNLLENEKLELNIELISKPNQFTKDFPFKITKINEDYFDTGFDITEYEINNGGVTYYVSKNGNDSNDGLTLGTALRYFDTAIAKSDIDTLLVDDGVWDRFDKNAVGQMIVVDKAINIKAINPDSVIIQAGNNDIGWVKTVGQTNVYEGTRVNTMLVVRYQGFNDTEFTEVSSISEVDSTPNSWYTELGVVYINVNGGEVPVNSEIHCLLLGVDSFKFNNDVYLENIILEGGGAPVRVEKDTVAPSAFLNKVTSRYCNGNGFQFIDVLKAYTSECHSVKFKADGYNYHQSTEAGQFLEYKNTGGNGGIGGSDQVSSAHDGFEGIRYKCVYSDNNEDIITDVDTNTVTWNINCDCYGSDPTGYDFEANLGAYMILEGCFFRIDTRILEAGGATLEIKNAIDI